MFKLLIVEDEEMIRKGLHYTFDWDSENIIVIGEAKNGEDGLQKISSLNPDIVLVDINMPIMDGITMLQEAVKNNVFSSIIISGYDEFSLAKEAIHLNVAEYLLKPLDYDQLHIALKKAASQITMLKNIESIESNAATSNKLSLIQDSLLNNNNTTTSKYVSVMLDYIHNNYKHKITIQDLVNNLGVSSTYLNNKFKKETSYTFNDYINRYRITQAINIMKTEDCKIYNVAYDVGFKDYRYFINVFKKYTNCVPSDFLDYFKNHTL